ncbi:MAG: hypothetical protein AAF492_33000, partial [Verrucomicrobiota bacterium]
RAGNIGWRHPGDGNDFSNPGGDIRINGMTTTAAAEGTWHILEAFRGSGPQLHDAIGGYFPARDYHGDIAEILVYDRLLTAGEVGAVGAYLASTYGLSSGYEVPLSIHVTEANAITASNALIHADLEADSARFDVWAYWGRNDGGMNQFQWSNSVFVGSFTNITLTNLSAVATNLQTNTGYYFTFRMTNCVDDLWSPTSGFFNAKGPPRVNNANGATDVVFGSATLHGAMTNGGMADVFIYWGTTNAGTNRAAWEQEVALGSLPEGRFSAGVNGVLYGVQYYYRTYATNLCGGSFASNTETFKTPRLSSLFSISGGMELWLRANSVGSNHNDAVGRWLDVSA